ncbi:tryptophan halogenase family protein [uncultured Erythrobacter sp.]|uniref:tryptophan halogenase family protein n=1 Tax=uncultured Erythrobacter sp. TaxID=263913 RepID=UPI002609F8D4|nr:tryptophan halogenase family protein [uncultured Erythrobacter sp.]
MIEALNRDDSSNRLRRIVIVGGGSAGWMAAAALSQVTRIPIVLIESDAIGTVGVGEATIPQIRTFNRALGIDERNFVRETNGSFKLGIRFVGWNGDGSDYIHAFGQVGRGTGVIPFHHLWLRAQAAGLAGPFGDYALNDVAARAGKMAMPGGGMPAQGTNMPWAYHFDASLYAAFLRRLSEQRGVQRIEGKIVDVAVDRERQSIGSITLEDGQSIEGDFFVDCSGFRALLISQLDGSDMQDWSHWLPCDSAQAVPCQSDRPLSPFTTSTAHKAGWQWHIPLQSRVGNGVVYCRAFMSDEEARDQLLANIDGPPDAEPRQIRFTTGTRRKHWVGNCLAVGLSAGFLEPLESTSIHLIQYSVARLMAMLPRRDVDPAIVDAFNHEISQQWARIRDFLILHYWANGRVGEEFWDACRTMDLPASLTEKIDQFRAAGHFTRQDEELFTQVGWSQVFLGQGIVPNSWHPLADEMSEIELRDLLSSIKSQHGRMTSAMPTHGEFVDAFIHH